jgi:hypothetical protein
MRWDDNVLLQVLIAIFLLVGGVGGWWFLIEHLVDA